MNNVLVIVNSDAGRKRAIHYRKKLQNFLLKNSTSFKFINIHEFSKTDLEKISTVIVMGGDGTVSKILPFIIDSDITLGIIPTGTANLLAQNLGISENINKAIEILKKNSIKELDVLKINDKLSILRTGFGYDANIICKTPQSIKNKFGYFSYFVAGIIYALRLKRKEYQFTIDKNTFKHNASCIIVANSANMYKNLVWLNSNSKLDDSLFEIFILTTTNPILFFIELLKILFHNYKNTLCAKYLKTNNLTIQNNHIIGHIDGEKCLINEDINISIIPSAIKIFK